MVKLGCLVATVILLVSSLALEQLASKCTGKRISCGSVTSKLVPRLNFITDKVNIPSNGCCVGAKQVAEMAEIRVDCQTACECIKKAIKNVINIDYNQISEIPKDCNLSVTLPPIKNSTECSSITMGNLFAD